MNSINFQDYKPSSIDPEALRTRPDILVFEPTAEDQNDAENQHNPPGGGEFEEEALQHPPPEDKEPLYPVLVFQVFPFMPVNIKSADIGKIPPERFKAGVSDIIPEGFPDPWVFFFGRIIVH